MSAGTLSFLGRAGTAVAQADSLGAQAADFIRDLSLQASDTLAAPGMSDDQRREEFRILLNAAFDVPLLGRFALGRYWQIATEEQRAEYMLLFEDSLVINYADRFRDYAGENLRVVQFRALPNDEALVTTDLPRQALTPIRLAWRVRREDNSFKVIDVIVEGASMAITQRDDYAATIQRSGGRVAALLTAMRDKNFPPPPPPPPR